MNNQAIFLPMLMNMALTAVVWFYMYAKRIPAMKRAKLSVQTYTTPGKIEEHLPESINYPANNLKNLFELPVLFYGLCLYLFVSANVDAVYVSAAWVFFAMRVVHSVVHSTRNIVMLRFYCYVAGALALWFMLARALFDAMSVYF